MNDPYQKYRRLKVGTEVIVKDLEISDEYHSPGRGVPGMHYASEMKAFANQKTYVTDVSYKEYGNLYHIEIDNNDWYWTDEFLEPTDLFRTNRGASFLLDKQSLID